MDKKITKEDKKRKKEEERLAKEKAKEEEKAKKEAERTAKEEEKKKQREKAIADEEAKKKALEEERQAKLKAKQREKLEKRLGIQKPGQYVIEVGSLDSGLINKIETRLRKIPDLHIDSTGGSWEGTRYGIRLDQPVPILLRLSDLPEVTEVKLDHGTIRVMVKSE